MYNIPRSIIGISNWGEWLGGDMTGYRLFSTAIQSTLHLSFDAFSPKVLIKYTIFYASYLKGTAILWSHPSHANTRVITG